MPSYKYTAINAQTGKQRSDLIEAETARQARSQLREQGWLVSDMQEVNVNQSTNGVKKAGLSGKQLALLTRQFATLINAGLPIEQALNVLFEQAEQAGEREILAAIRTEVLGGGSLYHAFSQHPSAFPELYRTLIAAGEESGKLGQVMDKLADYIEKRQALRGKLGLAMIYPTLMLLISSTVLIGLLHYVVPKVVEPFTRSKQALPSLTQFMLDLSDWIKHYGLYALIALGAGIGLFIMALKDESFKLKVHQWQLKIPLFGRLIRATNTARFASTLAILVGSGVPLLRALQAASGVVSNLAMRQAVEEATKQVREGASLSRALKQSQQFPPVLIHLIASGESTGRLDEMLERAAAQQSNELETRIATFMGVLEPFMIVIMGGMVLLIVLAILLPIMKMRELLG